MLQPARIAAATGLSPKGLPAAPTRPNAQLVSKRVLTPVLTSCGSSPSRLQRIKPQRTRRDHRLPGAVKGLALTLHGACLRFLLGWWLKVQAGAVGQACTRLVVRAAAWRNIGSRASIFQKPAVPCLQHDNVADVATSRWPTWLIHSTA